MIKIPFKKTQEFINTAHAISKANLVLCGSGNLSCRYKENSMLITTTGSWMSNLSSNDIAVCKISDGIVQNNKKPSIENKLHRIILQKKPDINVILHFQSIYATMIACSKINIKNFNIIPEIPYYIGLITKIKYINPGSDKLVSEISNAVLKHNLIILKNHGQIVIGKNFKEVIERAIFFEFASKIIVKLGKKADFLSQKNISCLSQMKNV